MELKIAFFIIVISVSNVFATPTYSQVAKVSLNMESKSLEQVMDEIESQSEFYFIFNQKQIDVNRVVDIQAENKLITDILPELFKGTNVNYAVFDRKILLTTDPIENSLLGITSGTGQQQIKVTGVITDKDGAPLPGVNVVVTGTTVGAITDIAGKYSIDIPQEARSLTFSFIGMEPQEITIGNLTQIDVTMVESQVGLEEVIVIGYGTQKKISLTGSVASISSKDIQDKNYPNVQSALQGKLSGLTITQQGGQPGNEEMTIAIRGVSTFSSNPPLIVVDGQFMDNMNSLNPEDLESVTVLKDAASAAIYGARASGGVILITTKNGKPGKMKVSYSGSFGFQDVTTYPKQLNAYEHALLYTEAQKNDNPNTTSFTWTAQQIEDFRTGKSLSFDKMEYLLKSAPQTEHNISFSGGNDDHTYLFSVGYLYQDSPIREFDYQRLNVRFREQFKISEKLSLEINASFIPEIVNHPGLYRQPRSISQTVYNLFLEAYRRDATQPLFTSDGKWATIGGWKNLIGVFSSDGGWGKDNKNLTTGIVALKWNIAKGLQLEGSYNGLLETSRNTNYSKKMNFYDPHEIDKISYVINENSFDIDHFSNYHHQAQALMNYHNTFSNVHDLKLLFGASSEWARDNSESVGRSYFLTDEIYAINAGSTDKLNWRTFGTSSDWAIASLFGRLNYIFNNKYYLESNFRYDGSSRFSSAVRWGLFPSASVGWRISEEPFFEMLQKTIPELKLRASWGQVGNQSTSLYQYYPRLNTSTYYFGGTANTTVSYANSTNEDLTWETKTTTNIGLDIIVLKNFNLTLDGFKDRTSGILMRPVVPSTFGMSAPVMNVGTVENLGWEAVMSYKNRYKDLGWGITFQISDAKNKVIEMIGSPVISNNTISEVGHEMNRWYGYEVEGIFSSQEQVEAHAFQNIKTGIGDLIYKDVHVDDKINALDRVDLGSSRPRFPFGLTLDLNWKNFDFSAFFQGVAKQQTYINGPGAQPFYRDLGTALKQHLDRWHQDDNGNWISGYYPKMRIGGVNISDFSSFWLQNSAYVRLKNIQLGYTLPKRWTKKVKIDNLRVYGNAQNLLTFTKMVEGIDPEAPNGDGAYFPLYKSVSFGVNVSF